MARAARRDGVSAERPQKGVAPERAMPPEVRVEEVLERERRAASSERERRIVLLDRTLAAFATLPQTGDTAAGDLRSDLPVVSVTTMDSHGHAAAAIAAQDVCTAAQETFRAAMASAKELLGAIARQPAETAEDLVAFEEPLRRVHVLLAQVAQARREAHEQFAIAQAHATAWEQTLLREEKVQSLTEFTALSDADYREAAKLEQSWFGLGKRLHKEKIKGSRARADQRGARLQFRSRASSLDLDYDVRRSAPLEREVSDVRSRLIERVQDAYLERLRGTEDVLDGFARGELPERPLPESARASLAAALFERACAAARPDTQRLLTPKLRAKALALIERARQCGYSQRSRTAMDAAVAAERARVAEEINALPYQARDIVGSILDENLSTKLDALVAFPDAMAKVNGRASLLAEAHRAHALLSAADPGAYDSLGHALALAEKRADPLYDFSFDAWRVAKDHPEFRAHCGADAVERADALLGRHTLDALHTTRPHTEESVRYAQRLMSYDGPAYAATNILNAWREPGYSGEQPFLLPMHVADGRETPVYEYLARQSDATLAAIAERSPAVGAIIALMREHPTTFHRRSIEQVSAEGSKPEWVQNPIAYEIDRHLLAAATERLASADAADQTFALGILARYNGPAGGAVYARLDAIVAGASEAVRDEIVHAVADHAARGADTDAVRFLARHLDRLTPTQRRALEWSEGRLLGNALRADAEPDVRDAVAALLELTPEGFAALENVYRTAFARDEAFGLSFQFGDPAALKYLAEHREEFLGSVADVRTWLPEYHPFIMSWHEESVMDRGAPAQRPAPTAYLDIVRKRTDAEVRAALLGHVKRAGALPPHIGAAFAEDLGLEPSGDVDAIVLDILALQHDPGVSMALKQDCYQPHMLRALVRRNPTHEAFAGFLTFARALDRAFPWEEAWAFLQGAEAHGVIALADVADRELAGNFLREFGTGSSSELFRAYAELLRADAVPPELVELGITETGPAGVNELRRVFRTVRADLVAHDRVERVEHPLVQGIAATLVRFDTSQWRRAGKGFGDIVGKLEHAREAGEIAPLPPEYVTGTLTVDELDREQLRAFAFSEGFRVRYEQLAAAFASGTREVPLSAMVHDLRERTGAAADEAYEDATRAITTAREAGRDERALRGMEMQQQKIRALRDAVRAAGDARELLAALLAYDQKENAVTTQAIRELAFALARAENPEAAGAVAVDPAAPSREGAVALMAAIEDLVLAEAVPSLDLPKQQRKRIGDIFNRNALAEDLRRMEGEATRGTRAIAAVPSRGVLAELSGYYGDACWTRQDEIVRNNPDLVGLAFVANAGDPVRERLVGSSLLFERTIGGERVLIVRGLNPLENAIRDLSAEDFVDEVLAYLAPIARARGCVSIAAPLGVAGALTNRPTIAAALAERFGSTNPRPLDAPLTFNGYNVADVVELMDLRGAP